MGTVAFIREQGSIIFLARVYKSVSSGEVKFYKNCWEHSVLNNGFRNEGNMGQNIWEQGNLAKLNFGEHVEVFVWG